MLVYMHLAEALRHPGPIFQDSDISIASPSYIQLSYVGNPLVRSYYAKRCSARNCGVDGISDAGMRRGREAFLKVRLGGYPRSLRARRGLLCPYG